MIEEADNLMANFGDNSAKEKYAADHKLLSKSIENIQVLLTSFHQFIEGSKTIDIKESFSRFNTRLEKTKTIFDSIAAYPSTQFKGIEGKEWSEIWSVIKSNLYIIQGVAKSAYIKSLMIVNFSKTEVDALTNEIVKHIPQSFNLIEADKYKKEYLQAVKEIALESNAKNNLWDRFLNILAGNIPFTQTPEERVMLRRWLDGEKGDL